MKQVLPMFLRPQGVKAALDLLRPRSLLTDILRELSVWLLLAAACNAELLEDYPTGWLFSESGLDTIRIGEG